MAEMRDCLTRDSPQLAPGARGAGAADPQWGSVEAIIPEVFDDLTTRRVLVMRYEPGAALSETTEVAEQLRGSDGPRVGSAPGEEGQLPLLLSIARWYGRGLLNFEEQHVPVLRP